MKIYGVQSEGVRYFTTKRAAMQYARTEAADQSQVSEGDITVEAVSVLPMTKQLIVDLINADGGWADGSAAVVARVKRKHT